MPFKARLISIGEPQAPGADMPVQLEYYDEQSGKSTAATEAWNPSNTPDLATFYMRVAVKCAEYDAQGQHFDRLRTELEPYMGKDLPIEEAQMEIAEAADAVKG